MKIEAAKEVTRWQSDSASVSTAGQGKEQE